MDSALKSQIQALRTLKTKALQDRYRALFGEATASSNRDHLFRRVAWRLQANAEGGLSGRAWRRARQLADHRELRLRAPRDFWTELEQPGAAPEHGPARDPRLPVAGTVLHRKYRDHQIQVTVLADGFAYGGRKFRSLSAIACEVTGTRWNGFAFFGLNPETYHG